MELPGRLVLRSIAAACLGIAGTGTLLPAAMAAERAAATRPADAARVAGTPPFVATPVAELREPWAMTFLPDGRLLVTEKRGALRLVGRNGELGIVRGVPAVDYGGQGGLGDVLLHPDFARNGVIYLSYAEAGEGDLRGAAVARATLRLGADGGELSELRVIWRQQPKVTGRGHYGHRLAFGPDGKLWITSGDRQKFDPAQDMDANLGKVLRLNEDGSVPADNPFAARGGVAAQVWTLGHRNPLGIAFDAQGQPWVHEMGPAGGDEFNRLVRGANYGYPVVSNGDHYDGREIPDHPTRPEFAAPAVTWTPVISPAGLVIYDGRRFTQWQGRALIGGLSSRGLVVVEFSDRGAREVARYPMQARIREVEQGPDGDVWVLEDERDGRGGRLLRLR